PARAPQAPAGAGPPRPGARPQPASAGRRGGVARLHPRHRRRGLPSRPSPPGVVNLDAIRGLTQPDQRSCGPSSLVAAHILLDASYRPASFSTEVLALHRSVTSPSFAGHAQMPWPQALGTPPWAVARAMQDFSGVAYRTETVRYGARG